MKRFDFDGFEVIQCYDRDSHVVALAADRDTALKIAKHSNSGYRSVHSAKRTVIVYESYKEWMDTVITPEKLRAQALAKLTPEEASALGV